MAGRPFSMDRDATFAAALWLSRQAYSILSTAAAAAAVSMVTNSDVILCQT